MENLSLEGISKMSHSAAAVVTALILLAFTSFLVLSNSEHFYITQPNAGMHFIYCMMRYDK